MNKFCFQVMFLSLASLITISTAQAARNRSDVVAKCSNEEATYEFHADSEGRITSATIRGLSDSQLDCRESRSKGEEVVCRQMFVPGNVLVLYTDGYGIMHYNVDSDSNNDGRKARCSGSYFK